MTKTLKRIGVIALVLAMVFSLSAVAFAAGDGSDSLGTGNTVTIKDKLIAFNPDETSIYAPAVTFSYAIATATVDVTITDENEVKAAVKGGVGAPTITDSNAYTMADTLTAAAAGAANEKDIVIDFSGVTFPSVGVYRYTVTRTITDDNSVLESKETITRSLDVYVKEENGARVIYGYILHDVTGDVNKDSTTKYDHYESEYKTSNLTVSKTLVNDSAMDNNKFPFSVTFANTKGAHIMVNAEKGASGKAAAAAMEAGATTSAPDIANGGIVKYIGIPNGFTADVYETNNVTGTSYRSEGAADTAAAAKVLGWTGDDAKSNTAYTAAATNATKTVDFTNTLEVISPTGVVMRVAPYAAMGGAGCLLFVLSKRSKREEEDA